jgi:hypothetical protein
VREELHSPVFEAVVLGVVLVALGVLDVTPARTVPIAVCPAVSTSPAGKHPTALTPFTTNP